MRVPVNASSGLVSGQVAVTTSACLCQVHRKCRFPLLQGTPCAVRLMASANPAKCPVVKMRTAGSKPRPCTKYPRASRSRCGLANCSGSHGNGHAKAEAGLLGLSGDTEILSSQWISVLAEPGCTLATTQQHRSYVNPCEKMSMSFRL